MKRIRVIPSRHISSIVVTLLSSAVKMYICSIPVITVLCCGLPSCRRIMVMLVIIRVMLSIILILIGWVKYTSLLCKIWVVVALAKLKIVAFHIEVLSVSYNLSCLYNNCCTIDNVLLLYFY